MICGSFKSLVKKNEKSAKSNLPNILKINSILRFVKEKKSANLLKIVLVNSNKIETFSKRKTEILNFCFLNVFQS